jgi:voltage-gated potassium channel
VTAPQAAAPDALARYERRSARPMTALALVFLVSYAAPILDPELDGVARVFLDWADVAIWAVFAADLGWRTRLAQSPVRFLLTHPIDVLAVLLPVFRPLRVLRVFAVSQTVFTRRHGLLASGQAIVVGAVLLVVVAALAMLDAERGAPDASITTFGDALWWGITTVTTVGYGDLYPVTGLGRVVAAALMLVGISMVGVISASVAAWFVAQTRSQERDRVAEMHAELALVRAQLASIQAAVGAPATPVTPPSTPAGPGPG